MRNLLIVKNILISLITFAFALVFSCSVQTADLDANLDILVDQFGYRPLDRKVAVLVVPPETETVSSRQQIINLKVISIPSQQVVFSGPAQPWNDGAIHSQSGDRSLWFDFSQVQTPGTYLIEDDTTGKQSFEFEIDQNVYRKVLIAATRMFFYQRSGFPKKPPYADSRWTDDAAFLGPQQDTEARFVNEKDNAALERDMQGGWFDAGDTNKYVTFALEPIHQLLDAYTQSPAPWTDDFRIPESGNGIPDLLDEVKFELQWLQRMQDDDGGVFIKIGTIDYNSAEKPSLDRRPRFYGPKCSSSTIANSSMFAHAALVFSQVPELASESEDLGRLAESAWEWFNLNPKEIQCDTQEIKAGDADLTLEAQQNLAVSAAVYLFALTQKNQYRDYISSHYQNTLQMQGSSFWSVYESYVGDALLFYTTLENADVNVQDDILNKWIDLSQNSPELYGQRLNLDPYRAYMPDEQYHWGSNSIKSKLGNSNYDGLIYADHPDSAQDYLDRSLGHLHYLHGVNPLGIVYLTNMYDYDAEKSANSMYHEWFGDGVYEHALTSPNGPAPGYVTGGPNKNYTGPLPLGELPPMKAYVDSSKGKTHMWEITEPAIYYQSAYLKLLSKFCE